MDAEIVKAFELLLVFGAVLAVGGYQVWIVRRDRGEDTRSPRRGDRSEWSE